MNKLLLILVFAFGLVFDGQSQSDFSYRVSDDVEVEYLGKINVRDLAQTDFHPSLRNIEAPFVGGDSYKDKLAALKQGPLAEYLSANTKEQEVVSGKTSVEAPELGINFRGNDVGGIPNDNHMAIGNEGHVISVINSNILYTHAFDITYDDVSLSLGTFSNSLGLATNKYDPKLVYDPNLNRFIMCFLAGTLSNEVIGGNDNPSSIILAFSETEDPTDDWNVYVVPGGPLMNGTWSDYPMLAITDQELFLTINLLADNESWQEGFQQTLIWQIFKADGFNGAPELSTRMYDEIKDGERYYRNIMPVKGGSEPLQQNMYFLSNRNFDISNDSIFLMQIQGLQFLPSTELEVFHLTSDVPYGAPPEAEQPGGLELNTNDARVLGGYYEDGVIHFVSNTNSTSTGNAAVFHGRIDDVGGANNLNGKIITEFDMHFGYPNVSYSGFFGDDQCVISFNHSSAEVNPGFSAMVYNQGEYSDRLVVKEGSAFITYNNGDIGKRWGDYSGSQRYYADLGTVWTCGTYGFNSSGQNTNVYGTWIAELKTSFGGSLSSIEENETVTRRVSIYPNPAPEMFHLEFDLSESGMMQIDLFDVSGKLVTTLLRGNGKEGMNLLSFSTHLLSTGQYVVRISTLEGREVFQQQLSVQR